MPAPFIKRLGPSDAEVFYALRLRCMLDAAAFFRKSPDDVRAEGVDLWRARLAGADNRIVGVFDGDILVGIGGIVREPHDKLQHKALLYGMFVAGEATGRGIGFTIVEALIAEARGWVQSLHLTLMADNNRARMLYERCGFTVYGREPQSVLRDAVAEDELLMWRAIDSVGRHG
jgi:GNAT superfamily N-acetyltransferase